MKNVSGDLNTFLEALGKKQGDNLILKAITIIAMDFEIENFECENIKNTYFHFYKRGVDFVFTKKNEFEFLESIFFYLNQVDKYSIYPFVRDLIKELDYPFNRKFIIDNLGKPEKESDSWIRYSIKNKYIHFEFNSDGEVSLITLFIEI
ncbi:hypothetical protein [Exercitatus varius]|uniref:hypothetical protein n=1 Tax=Exercitatus varius TaxID=67857 RepID=UPI00294ACDAF|nr:hypothetical protein [Exercitatus varius]MDG2959187.1 hypothetical protein [Exercitatus varius]